MTHKIVTRIFDLNGMTFRVAASTTKGVVYFSRGFEKVGSWDKEAQSWFYRDYRVHVAEKLEEVFSDLMKD